MSSSPSRSDHIASASGVFFRIDARDWTAARSLTRLSAATGASASVGKNPGVEATPAPAAFSRGSRG
jgi:hypothetical protein